MKVLVLSGEVTHQRPITYGFPSDWEVQVLSIVDPEHLALCEKYGDPKSISPTETVTFLKRAYDRAITQINDTETDAIVGIGYGAHVLMNLNMSHEWRGPSVFVLTEGTTKYNFVPRPLLDEIDLDIRSVKTAWITLISKETKSSGTKINLQARKTSHDLQEVLQIAVLDKNWQDCVYGTGLLTSCLKSLVM